MYNNHNRKNHIKDILVAFLVWFALTALCYLAIFKSLDVSKLPHTIPMLILLFTAFMGSIYVAKAIFRFPRLNKPLTLGFVTLMGYVLLLTAFATFRIYYSRSFVLISILINYVITYLILVSQYEKLRPKFFLLYPGNSISEHELIDYGVVFITDLSINGDNYDGIIVKNLSVINPEISELFMLNVFIIRWPALVIN